MITAAQLLNLQDCYFEINGLEMDIIMMIMYLFVYRRTMRSYDTLNLYCNMLFYSMMLYRILKQYVTLKT